MAGSQFKRFGLPAGPGSGNVARSRHLEMLQRFRNGDAPPRPDLGFGAVALSIPELDYYVLLARFPDLNSQDIEIKRRAWLKLANSEVGAIYRVQQKSSSIRK